MYGNTCVQIYIHFYYKNQDLKVLNFYWAKLWKNVLKKESKTEIVSTTFRMIWLELQQILIVGFRKLAQEWLTLRCSLTKETITSDGLVQP